MRWHVLPSESAAGSDEFGSGNKILPRRNFLEQMSAAVVASQLAVTVQPVSAATGIRKMDVREWYAPGHFGNSYEVMGEREMRDLLKEAVYWGFNRYGEWFDMIDCSDPFAERRLYNLGHALWDRKKANFLTAQALGLECDLIITPNHVFRDQCLPELIAVMTGRIFGQLICPSIPAARKTILADYENIFRDLRQSGVHLKSINLGPYDYGGCACDACKPYIVTFAKLSRDIHSIAERYHPGVEANFIGWWWEKEEHQLFADWADREAPGWVNSIYLHIPYREMDVGDVPLPRGCHRRAFIHIGYAQVSANDPQDKYGHLGPVIAAARLERTLHDLTAGNVDGYMTYSEGVHDDVNKAIIAGISSGKFHDADEALCMYAQRYFNASDTHVHTWARWLKNWDEPFQVNPTEAFQCLEKIPVASKTRSWRLRQWELKVELFKLNAMIGDGMEWTPERLYAVEKFWEVQEKIFRQIWGLGPLRHVFARKYTPLPWYASWEAFMNKQKPDGRDVMGREY